MAKVLPPGVKEIFCYLEPLSLFAGAISPVIAPEFFVSTQLSHLKPHALLATEHVLELQLGNLYFGLFLLAVFLLNITTDPKVVRAYLFVLAISDIGHMAATGWVMGSREFFKMQTWFGSATNFGNLTFVLFLLCTRTLYLLGLLGKDQSPRKRAKRS